MKKLIPLLLVIFSVACRDTFMYPTIWSESCTNFSKRDDGYLLEARCCESIRFENLKLERNKSFATVGLYSYATVSGGGGTNMPVQVTGKLSKDGQTLSLNYTAPADTAQINYNLSSTGEHFLCDCFCAFK